MGAGPVSAVTDEAVRALRKKFYSASGTDSDKRWRDALEAAVPYLAPEVGWEAVTLEQVIIHLHEYQHGERQCVQGNCRRRATAAQLAPAVLALISGTSAVVAVSDDQVTVNPKVRFGKPAVNGVSVGAICEQYESGASVKEIARDYGLTTAAVDAALTYAAEA